MSKALPAGRSWPSLPDLDLIASQTRLITRNSRKFTATGFLQSLLSSVATGLASLNQIAGDLKDRDHPGMARQSLHERFDIRSTAFLMAVLGDLMQQRYSTAATAIGSCGIQRAASSLSDLKYSWRRCQLVDAWSLADTACRGRLSVVPAKFQTTA